MQKETALTGKPSAAAAFTAVREIVSPSQPASTPPDFREVEIELPQAAVDIMQRRANRIGCPLEHHLGVAMAVHYFSETFVREKYAGLPMLDEILADILRPQPDRSPLARAAEILRREADGIFAANTFEGEWTTGPQGPLPNEQFAETQEGNEQAHGDYDEMIELAERLESGIRPMKEAADFLEEEARDGIVSEGGEDAIDPANWPAIDASRNGVATAQGAPEIPDCWKDAKDDFSERMRMANGLRVLVGDEASEGEEVSRE